MVFAIIVGVLAIDIVISMIIEGIIEVKISKKKYGANPINTDYYEHLSVRKCRVGEVNREEFNERRFAIILAFVSLISLFACVATYC